jgi:two-component system CheB/CheR fusion protein
MPPAPAEDGSGRSFPIVGIGASAGGLDACRKLIASLPVDSGMALILVQHLDPTHESMLVELLASHTTMPVSQAGDGTLIEPDHLYIIPPGAYLSVLGGALHLSQPETPHGARLPYDFLLRSLARDFGRRAIAVVLSGTGTDGSLGVRTIHAHGGLVIVQQPQDAGFDGMPRSAIATECVDLILPVAEIGAALIRAIGPDGRDDTPADQTAVVPVGSRLRDIIDLVRVRTSHDFRLYKIGTLERRIERRMSMASIDLGRWDQYLALLYSDEEELHQLARDLLINTTSFFRDPIVFAYLADQVIPTMLRDHPADRPLRIWVAGCSTGEETYSLAILFSEAIAAAGSPVKFQIFASDVDADAVATARDGIYPSSIAADLSAERLARFFTKEEKYYRVTPELRATVVLAVHDVLADPPFSRLDFVSCRNLLIYLQPEAQNKVLSLFHFALREGGLLLLGSSETSGGQDSHFSLISKPARLYRHIARSRPGELELTMGNAIALKTPPRSAGTPPPSRHASLAELCRRHAIERFAPAMVLINRRSECLYFLGPVEPYLRVSPGPPSHDLLAMARPNLRTKLRSAIQQAHQSDVTITVTAEQRDENGVLDHFAIEITPLHHDGEVLLLLCFIPQHSRVIRDDPNVTPEQLPKIAALERELVLVRAELQSAIHNLEISNEEQKAINEDALSVNEEYQSTNEELLTSKEELQSLNEELTALNSQLQETLERQRTTANDLQNVLFSTDVATLFLDRKLNIRLFTPATRMLFAVIPTDIGRPLMDLRGLTNDSSLLTDATAVLSSHSPRECEVEGPDATWYIRRVLPYRTQNGGIEGVVVTYADITERRRIAVALEEAKRQAEQASLAKSRFLAAASHDLRQPLQTLSLQQGLLARSVTGEKLVKMVTRMGETLGAMSGMLNTLLDINQIEAGTVRADIIRFSLSELLRGLTEEYAYHAAAQGLVLRSVPCSLEVDSDPRLLEQMIRNLLSNALKYTQQGKVLLGCRRRGASVSIEVWDTGIGIAVNEHEAIFEEYHQVNNAARERSRGLGLGLSIVQRLGHLLKLRVSVRSNLDRGSAFAIEVPLPTGAAQTNAGATRAVAGPLTHGSRGTILLVEDDPEVRDILAMLLQEEGHNVIEAHDGPSALARLGQEGLKPDVILADYNLPNRLNGLQLAAAVRRTIGRDVPVIILTGDISTGTLRHIAQQNCIQLNKPVKLPELIAVVNNAMPLPAALSDKAGSAVQEGQPTIFLVDDDIHVRAAISGLLRSEGREVEDFASCEAFLAAFRPGREGCLLIDAALPGMKGIELLQHLRQEGHLLPSIMITGRSDVSMAVSAMKAGATDFIEKPVGREELLAGVARALAQSHDSSALVAWRTEAEQRLATLTPRQIEIMRLVLAGQPSKNIAADLGISQRTVENHRAAIMEKTGSKSLPALARLVLAVDPLSDSSFL